MKKTVHYRRDRKTRRNFILENIGYGVAVQIEVIDRGHKDGKEFHVLTSTGIIEVYNYFTHKHITDMVARPNQIKTEFDEWTQDIIELARYHKKMGWNEI